MPKGTRRYAPPEAWSGSYNNGAINGTYNANIMCPQPTNANSTIPCTISYFFGLLINIQAYMSEDCLFLNIFSPSRAYISANGSVPVMFFVHGFFFVSDLFTLNFSLGGSFVAGSSSQYNGVGLAALEHVVVVAINYRLGPFGFLATSKLLSSLLFIAISQRLMYFSLQYNWKLGFTGSEVSSSVGICKYTKFRR